MTSVARWSAAPVPSSLHVRPPNSASARPWQRGPGEVRRRSGPASSPTVVERGCSGDRPLLVRQRLDRGGGAAPAPRGDRGSAVHRPAPPPGPSRLALPRARRRRGFHGGVARREGRRERVRGGRRSRHHPLPAPRRAAQRAGAGVPAGRPGAPPGERRLGPHAECADARRAPRADRRGGHRSAPLGGVAVFEEADYYPLLAGATSSVFVRVAMPLVGRWTWARLLPSVVAGHPVDEVDVVVDAPMLHGGSAEAAFWTATFTSARPRLAVGPADFDEVITLLADPAFWTPFAAVVCVSCRKR